MNATTSLLHHRFWTATLGATTARRSTSTAGRVVAGSSRARAFRCNAASLTSEDDAALEAEAERPRRLAQQVRALASRGVPVPPRRAFRDFRTRALFRVPNTAAAVPGRRDPSFERERRTTAARARHDA